ncbi:MAG: hypothetical protein LBN10_12360 [Propionibacteriaceae bacterium]|jgi:hypothetical protein|nr:hypothetical protein [Propionibacteriaceae bacterium]
MAVFWPVDTAEAADNGTTYSSAGREFWLAFNSSDGDDSENSLRLYVTGWPGTTGRTVIESLDFSEEFIILDDGVAVVEIPVEARLSLPTEPVPLAVHVTADADVTIYGMNHQYRSTDTFLGLPVSALGTRYRAVGYFSGGGHLSLIAAVATVEATTIHVAPPSSSALAPFDVTLQLGEVYEWHEATDLTGTVITSDKPISVFSGNQCATVPAGQVSCDRIMEQMIPTNGWGKEFVAHMRPDMFPDTFRVLADQDTTEVKITGGSVDKTISLSAGEHYDFRPQGTLSITASQPVAVVYYSSGNYYLNSGINPSMTLVLPLEWGFTDSVLALLPSSATLRVKITAPRAMVGSVLLNGTTISAGGWVSIPGSNYSGTFINLEPGFYSVTSPVPIQTIVNGLGAAAAYGYPGGARTPRFPGADTLTLDQASATGPVREELCTTATLADKDGVGIAGARIEVTLNGVVSEMSSLVTGDDGTVSICSTSSEEGSAAVTATQADLRATGSLTWTPPNQTVHVVYTDDDVHGVPVSPTPGTVTTYTGAAGSSVGFTEEMARAGVPVGFDFASLDNVTEYDDDLAVDQTITVHLSHHHSVDSVETTRTITYTGAGDLTPEDVVQPLEWTKDTDKVTGAVTYTPTGSYPAVTSPIIHGYTVDLDVVEEISPDESTDAPSDTTVTVTYTKTALGPEVHTGGSVMAPVGKSASSAGAALLFLLGGSILTAVRLRTER